MRREQSHVEYRLNDHVAWITMNRPSVLNALSAEMFRGLRRGLESSRKDPHVVSIVITGRGTAFSAGLDIKQVGRFRSSSAARAFVYDLVKPFWDALLKCEKPIVSMVNGPAYGAGAEIALASDIVLASTNATIAFSGGRVGALCCISPVLGPFLMNGRKLVEMNLTGSPISAEEAVHFGLVNQVVSPNNLRPKTEQVLKEIRKISPISNASFKHILRTAFSRKMLETAYRELLRTISSPDFREGSRAFREKREPAYSPQ